MITVASEISPAAGNSITATGGARHSDNSGADQTFGGLLGDKIVQRQQAAPTKDGADNGTADRRNDKAGASSDRTASAPNKPVAVDSAEQKHQQRLADGNDSDNNDYSQTAAADPAGQDVATDPATASAHDNHTPDPALDSTAAQALMALLAQTQPAALAAADVAADTDPDGQSSVTPGQTAGTVPEGTATAQDPAVAANSVAAQNPAIRDNSAPAAAPVMFSGTGKYQDKTAATQTLPAGMKMAATAVDNGQTAKLHAAVKDQGAPADSAVAAAVNPQLQSPSDAGQDTAGEPSATLLGLKKTASTIFDNAATPSGAAPAATPTLSAAGTGAAATPTPASALISAQLGSDEWQQAIGQQVVMFARNGQQNAELRLHPENLGSLQISLQVDTNNQMQIHLVSGHSQVRAALEDALPHLRDALAQSGINLGQSSVGSDAMPNRGGNGQDAPSGNRGGEVFSLNAIGSRADNVIAPAPKATPGRTSGIDTFV